jgi:hypothetical protein
MKWFQGKKSAGHTVAQVAGIKLKVQSETTSNLTRC